MSRLALRVSAAMLLATSTGATQSPAALAETLFQEAKRLMDDKRFPEACPKLAESQRLDPGTGTLILLASCHESEGKLASAWSEYVDAQAQATQAGRKDRIKAAEDGVKRVLPRLSKLTVKVRADAKVPGLAVKVDGAALAEAVWGVATPVDPGEHVVEATAPGKVPFKATLSFTAAADVKSVEIVPLEALPSTAVVAPPPTAAASASVAPTAATSTSTVASPPPPSSDPPSRTPAYVVGGIGGVSLLVGTFFGLKARSDTNSANSICPQKQCSSDEGLAKSDSAGSAAKLANVFVGLGVVGVGVGAVLWMRGSGSKTQSGLKIAPTFTSRQAGLSAEGAF